MESVTPNWKKNFPITPLMKATGRKMAMMAMVVAMAGHSRFRRGAASIQGGGSSFLTVRARCLASGPMAAQSQLSTKPIPPRERLILALDVPSLDEGKRWVECCRGGLGERVGSRAGKG